MSRQLLFCIGLLVIISIGCVDAARLDKIKSSCGRHGDDCNSPSDCCSGLRCHTYANRCQVIITAEELLRQRQKILKIKD